MICMGLKIPLPLGFSSSEPLNLKIEPGHREGVGAMLGPFWGLAARGPASEHRRPRLQVLGSGRAEEVPLPHTPALNDGQGQASLPPRLESSLRGFPHPLSEEAEPSPP